MSLQVKTALPPVDLHDRGLQNQLVTHITVPYIFGSWKSMHVVFIVRFHFSYLENYSGPLFRLSVAALPAPKILTP